MRKAWTSKEIKLIKTVILKRPTINIAVAGQYLFPERSSSSVWAMVAKLKKEVKK